MHREQQRKGGEQRGQHADRERACAELQRVQRKRDLAAALRDGGEDRSEHDEVKRHTCVLRCGTRF
jgi:hypothetical protein